MALIHRCWPSTRIVVVSAHDQPDTVGAALARGAASFLSKTDRPERMIAVLDEAPLGGGVESGMTVSAPRPA